MTQIFNDDLPKRAQMLLERALATPQPLSGDISRGVEMHLAPKHRIGLALLILGVVPEGDAHMTEKMQSRSYASILVALREVLPNLPAQVRRLDIEAALTAAPLDEVKITLPPMTIYDLSKVHFEGAFWTLGKEFPDAQILLDGIVAKNTEITHEDLSTSTSTVGELCYDLYREIGMNG